MLSYIFPQFSVDIPRRIFTYYICITLYNYTKYNTHRHYCFLWKYVINMLQSSLRFTNINVLLHKFSTSAAQLSCLSIIMYIVQYLLPIHVVCCRKIFSFDINDAFLWDYFSEPPVRFPMSSMMYIHGEQKREEVYMPTLTLVEWSCI